MSSFDTLVLCGGGLKGIITLGALQYAIDQYLIQEVKRYYGSSVGSIISYLLAIGYTPIEIIVYLCTTKLTDINYFDILSMTNGQGALNYSIINDHLEKMTIDKIGKFLTLGELKNKYNKELICSTYNLTDNQIDYISYENHPDMPCLTAIRLSSNLPFIFEKYKYMGKYYIDGGVADNFPISIADKQECNTNILGIVITSDKPDIDTKNILEYAYELISIPTYQYINMNINNASTKCKVLNIKSKTKLKAFEFDIPSKDKLDMFSNGYNKAKKFFSKFMVL